METPTETTAIAKQEKAVLMRSGAVHWIDLETAQRVEAHIASQQGHSFIRLKDKDMTINTAEVEGVYTPEQYADVQKSKNGYWQCERKAWHFKREKCECAKEAAEAAARARQDAKMAEMSREQTPEERERSRSMALKVREVLHLKGTFPGGMDIRESTLKEYEAEHGSLPPARMKIFKIIKGQ